MTYAVYAFGSNGSGQLAVGHRNDIANAAQCLFYHAQTLPTARPAAIAAGGNHTLLRLSNGEVYAAGHNGDGRCGLRPVESDDNKGNTEIEEACFTTFRRVLFESDVGKKLELFSGISATWSASFFLTQEGTVYSAGTGFKGELGLGTTSATSASETITSAPVAVKVRLPTQPGEKVVQLASGVNHTIAITPRGIYGWGSGRHGELGKPLETVVSLPRFIAEISAPLCPQVVCGLNFTYILHAQVYDSPDHMAMSKSTQCVSHELLGPSAKHLLRTNLPTLLQDDTWANVSASWNTVYLTNREGTILSWGRGDRGQLAPKQISKGGDRGIINLIAGSEHVLSLGHDGKIRVWGWGEHGNCGPTANGTHWSSDVGRLNAADGVEYGDWNDIVVEKGRNCVPLGAGCATSWLTVFD